jgi:hypothetical protein
MAPRDLIDRILILMVEFARAHGRVDAPRSPFDFIFGSVPFVDPSRDEGLNALGVGSVTPWVEALGRMGYVGAVGPMPTGWLVFLPSAAFYDAIESGLQDSLRRQSVDTLTTELPSVVTTASTTVADLRTNLGGVLAHIDAELLDVLLRELHEVLQRDCRHATIAICGKLLELGLGALLAEWGVEFPSDATLAVLIDRVRGRANLLHPVGAIRARAQELLDLGVPGMMDLIRTVRNGAVHAKPSAMGGRAELPSSEQAEAVALLTTDILKRFVLQVAG